MGKDKIRSQRHKIWDFLGQEGELTYVRFGYDSDYEAFMSSPENVENGKIFELTESINELAFCAAHSDIFSFPYLGKDYWIAHCE